MSDLRALAPMDATFPSSSSRASGRGDGHRAASGGAIRTVRILGVLGAVTLAMVTAPEGNLGATREAVQRDAARQLRSNMLGSTQSSFEGGFAGWRAAANSSIRSFEGVALLGRASLALTAHEAGYMSAVMTSGPGVSAGSHYVVAARFRAASRPTVAGMSIRWLSADGTVLLTQDLNSLVDRPDRWLASHATVAAPTGAASLVFIVAFRASFPGETHFVDGVTVTAGRADEVNPISGRLGE